MSMQNKFDIFLDSEKNDVLSNYFTPISDESPIRYFENFSKINIFVGANNSGKSRFMRELMSLEKLEAVTEIRGLKKVIKEYNEFLKKHNQSYKFTAGAINRIAASMSENEFSELKLDQNEVFNYAYLNEFSEYRVLLQLVRNNRTKNLRWINAFHYYFSVRYSYEAKNFSRSIYVNGKSVDNTFFDSEENHRIYINFENLLSDLEKRLDIKLFSNKRIYIPTLRTAHSLFKYNLPEIKEPDSLQVKVVKIRDDIFLDTIKKNYSGLTNKVEIFTGLNLYNEIVNVRNSVKEERTRFHEFESFLSENFFEGKDIDIVAKFNIDNNVKSIEDDDLIQIYIGGKSRELHNLGDGVQSLIILMYKIFLAPNDSLIFIDEPELNLHPGYQRLFLEQITSNPDLTKKNLRYVIVTHSNHFLDLTLEKNDISIYSFNSIKKDKFLIKNVNLGDNEILKDLGVNNSSVFLANSSIWVEGVSDRNLIKAFLLAYCKAKKIKIPREDIDFAFFEYAGSNLVHYNFKKSTNDYDEIKDLITSYALNNRILLFSDLDSGKDSKHKNIEEIANETEGFEYLTTRPFREIENLIPNTIWEKVLINFCNEKKIKGKEENVQKRIKESLSKTKSDNYKGKYIGSFLNDLQITELNKIFKEDDKKEPGTLIPKAELSQLVLNKVRENKITWDDFSANETIVNITNTVYKFVSVKN